MINAKYKAQLIAMVTPEFKDALKADADAREVSLSQVAREYLEAGRNIKLDPDPDIDEIKAADGTVLMTIVHSPDDDGQISRSIVEVTYPDADTLEDAEHGIAEADDRDPEQIEHDARIARLKAKGIG